MPARFEKTGFWVWVTAAVFYPIAAIGKTRRTGAEHIRRDGGILLVMNHISHLDPPVDAVFVHRNGRVPRFLAKESLFRMPVFKHMITGAGSIPVYRQSVGAAGQPRRRAGGAAERQAGGDLPGGHDHQGPDRLADARRGPASRGSRWTASSTTCR